MPINATPQYFKAQAKYDEARTNPEKLVALNEMLKLAPKHKGAEVLLSDIKTKISKLKKLMEKEKQSKKGSGKLTSIKKVGAAQVVIIGPTNSGKSTLLSQLTNLKPKISPVPFTTKKPQIGIMDYGGIKLQIIEVPPIVKNFIKQEEGPMLMNVIRHADLIILTFNNPEEKKLLDKELYEVKVKKIIFNKIENFKDKIWSSLNLIKIHTKQPGKKPDFPPVALKKGSTIRDLAEHVHKDFIKKFRFARLEGKSAKFKGQQVGLNHKLQENDIVELHLK